MVDTLKHNMWNRKIRRWMMVWIFFTLFMHRWENIIIFLCLFRIIDCNFATYRFEIFRFCLRWCFFRNIDQDGWLLNFLSISGKTWRELWHSGHNEILAPLSQCSTSGYFKNCWGWGLFLKSHRGTQNVYFFYFSGDAHFTSEVRFWIIFSTGEYVIGSF